jgi:hypothetical protein
MILNDNGGYKMETITSGKNIFEVVDFIPYGYHIWNIGKNMIEGYLPLVQLGGYNGCCVIGVKKAIQVDGAQTILDAIGYGEETIQEMEDYISKHKNSKEEIKIMQISKYKKALPIMRIIKWNL